MATNELTLFNSSVSTVDGNMSGINNGIEREKIDEDMILAQLNELRLWQESQRQTLVESQMDQKKLLKLEKQKLYALFGLIPNESSINDAAVYSTESSFGIENHHHHESPQIQQNDQKIPTEGNSLALQSPSINQLQKIIKNMTNRSPRREIQQEYQETLDIPKRSFLKRGEGLKNRFKISPDAFRLDKLPKYKYAQHMQKHAQSRCTRKQRHQEITTNDTIAAAGEAATCEGQQNNPKSDCITTKENSGKISERSKRPSPRTQQLKLKPSIVQQHKLKESSDGVKQFIQQTSQGIEMIFFSLKMLSFFFFSRPCHVTCNAEFFLNFFFLSFSRCVKRCYSETTKVTSEFIVTGHKTTARHTD